MASDSARNTVMPVAKPASAALPAGTTAHESPRARAPSSCGKIPRTGRKLPSSESSPMSSTPSMACAGSTPIAPKIPDRDRQIQRGAALTHIRRRQIHGDCVLVEQHAQARQRTGHTHPRLSHGGFGQPHHLKERRAAGRRHLHLNRMRVETDQRAGVGDRQAEFRSADGRGGVLRRACPTAKQSTCRIGEPRKVRGAEWRSPAASWR